MLQLGCNLSAVLLFFFLLLSLSAFSLSAFSPHLFLSLPPSPSSPLLSLLSSPLQILATVSLEDTSSYWSALTLGYLDAFLKKGASAPLTSRDLGGPSEIDKSSFAIRRTMEEWDKQPVGKKSVAKALWRGYGPWKIGFAWCLYLISAVLTFFPVLVLNQLVLYFQALNTPQPYELPVNVWILVSSLAILPLLITLLQARHNVIMSHLAVFVRTAVSLLVYQKSLTISAEGRAETSTGQVVNMMSNDTTQLQRFLQFFGFVTGEQGSRAAGQPDTVDWTTLQ